jgi:hypothetical protein
VANFIFDITICKIHDTFMCFVSFCGCVFLCCCVVVNLRRQNQCGKRGEKEVQYDEKLKGHRMTRRKIPITRLVSCLNRLSLITSELIRI